LSDSNAAGHIVEVTKSMSTGPLRILLLDDNPHDRQLTLRELEKEFPDAQATEPIDVEEFHRAVIEADYELVITDFQLRWTTGIQVIRTVKDARPHCPVIMFTATGTQEVAVEAMKAGLDDYVIKSPQHYIRLTAAVRSCLDRAEIRKRALRSETRLQTLLNRLNVGVFRMGLDGELVDANPASQKILDRFGSAATTESSPNALLQATRAILPELNQLNDAIERELHLEATGGEMLSIYLSLLRVRINGHHAIDALVEDLTRMHRVVERSAELEEANRALEAFAFTVSHDLREPLRNIQGYLNALTEDCWNVLPKKGQGYVSSMVSVASRMEALIADVLEFSRLSSADLPPERVPLGKALHEALELMQNATRGSGATIDVDENVQVEVSGHYQTIVQVLANLLSNSLKFVRDGEQPAVRIWSEQRGWRIRLWVEDRGIGIAPENHRRIFEVFQRLHGEEKYLGTGVGLALVRKGVERMGGQTGVESTLDNGSRFWIELKRAE
jgi:signal transduction histidine kinase